MIGDIMARMTNDLNAVRMLLGPAIMYSANTVLFSIGAVAGFVQDFAQHSGRQQAGESREIDGRFGMAGAA